MPEVSYHDVDPVTQELHLRAAKALAHSYTPDIPASTVHEEVEALAYDYGKLGIRQHVSWTVAVMGRVQQNMSDTERASVLNVTNENFSERVDFYIGHLAIHKENTA